MPDFGTEWIAYATRRPLAHILALDLTPAQAATLGTWLSENKLLNPPKRAPLRPIRVLCQCGCGEWFDALYKTSRPKYKNATHRQRAYRARLRARAH